MGRPLQSGAVTRLPSIRRRPRWGSALVLLALLGQWMLAVASTAHHAVAAAAAGPWQQVCSAKAAPAGDAPADPLAASTGATVCPVCAAAATPAPPAAEPILPVAAGKAESPVRALHSAHLVALALRPPARAPPSA